MHELPVAQSVIEQASAAAKQAGIARITGITLVVGQLSDVIDESIGMYFGILVEGTPAEGAKLEFVHKPCRLRCAACEAAERPHEYDKPPRGFACPVCGADGVLIRGTGRELYIESIEG